MPRETRKVPRSRLQYAVTLSLPCWLSVGFVSGCQLSVVRLSVLLVGLSAWAVGCRVSSWVACRLVGCFGLAIPGPSSIKMPAKQRSTHKMSNPTTDLKRHSGGWWDKVAQASAADPGPDVACCKNEVTGPAVQGEFHESNASSYFPVDAGGSTLQPLHPTQSTQSSVLCLTPSNGFNRVDDVVTPHGDHIERKRKPVRLEFARSRQTTDLLVGATHYK